MVEKKQNKNREFAIGSKIQYNGKLYKVVEEDFCDNCSIKNICVNSDESNNIDNCLTREQRLHIFRECSAVARSDGKSVVFRELPADKEADVYDIDVLYKNDKELLPIKINIPNGYVIDEETSDLPNGIINFKNKWLSLEQIYRLLTDNNISQYRNNCMSFAPNKLLAITNLMDIARYFNGNWNYNAKDKDSQGYAIYYNDVQPDGYGCNLVNLHTSVYYGTPIFKNESDAKYVIDNPNFRSILDKIFKL